MLYGPRQGPLLPSPLVAADSPPPHTSKAPPVSLNLAQTREDSGVRILPPFFYPSAKSEKMPKMP